MSVDASGKFGGTLVFAKWKGRPYVRQLVTPKNPQAAKQVGVRAMMAFLARRWKYLSGVIQATWEELAAARTISPFNAYVGENLMRWQEWKGPTQEYPAAESANAITTTQVLDGGQGFCTITNTPSGAGDNWGVIIMRDTAAITSPNWNLVIAVIPANGASAVAYTDSPLAAGTYHYRSAICNDDGTIGTVCADDDEAVT
jgi:hypothetical protein